MNRIHEKFSAIGVRLYNPAYPYDVSRHAYEYHIVDGGIDAARALATERLDAWDKKPMPRCEVELEPLSASDLGWRQSQFRDVLNQRL